jgi:hypothetical protein
MTALLTPAEFAELVSSNWHRGPRMQAAYEAAYAEVARLRAAILAWQFQQDGANADPVNWPDLGVELAEDALRAIAAEE